MGAASGVAPKGLVSETVDEAAEVADARVNRAVATMPEPTVFAFTPVMRQVFEPATILHVTDLPAAVAAGPFVTVTPVKWAVE